MPAFDTRGNVVQVGHIRYIMRLGLKDLVLNAWPKILNAHVPQCG